MKTVSLFRHAKSDWKDSPSIADFDRPLSDRGLKAAPKMGEAMRERGLHPDLVLCSTSVRTRQTWALAAPMAFDIQPEVRFEQGLYHATSSQLIERLRELDDDLGHVMIVGHNPGLQALALALCRPGDDELAALREKLPTAALAILTFDDERWQDLQPRAGDLILFLTPKQLRKA